LQSQEKTKGFREKPGKSSQFFRHGRSGTWRDVLSQEQAKAIIDAHRPMMLRFGYLDEAGNPLF
jgi:hypothetical protein